MMDQKFFDNLTGPIERLRKRLKRRGRPIVYTAASCVVAGLYLTPIHSFDLDQQGNVRTSFFTVDKKSHNVYESLVVVTLTTVSSSPWAMPAGSKLSRVQCWGPGGSGGAIFSTSGSQRLATGAGGGGYGELNQTASLSGFTAGNSYAFQVGAGGAAVINGANGNAGSNDTWFGAASYAAATVGGQKGLGGVTGIATTAINGGIGGGGKGDVSFSGGRGGNISSATGGAILSTGGGGSAGPDGAGSNGGDLSGASILCSAGGNADNGTISGGIAGNFAVSFAGPGSSTANKGGGGGGGDINNPSAGGAGGDFGGGGGASAAGTSGSTSGAGGNGRILVSYYNLVAFKTSLIGYY